ncbi:unnamed protein product [Enterobius vermicularis]|uniref:PK_Tyr_Ser-Thr domain-containing protein n=1 Tax=Enterobius vermicularis TaxID=51028 RepID=A0A0N4V2A6_ENTVE|nr:unnamed protein product [Enterobius vermicularis]
MKPLLPDDLPPDLKNMLSRCLSDAAQERPSFEEIVKMFSSLKSSSWFQKVDESQWSELCLQWNSFAETEVKREKNEMDEYVKQILEMSKAMKVPTAALCMIPIRERFLNDVNQD